MMKYYLQKMKLLNDCYYFKKSYDIFNQVLVTLIVIIVTRY